MKILNKGITTIAATLLIASSASAVNYYDLDDTGYNWSSESNNIEQATVSHYSLKDSGFYWSQDEETSVEPASHYTFEDYADSGYDF
ncbi:MAG: hypothetical protein HOM84_00890 [Thiotrichales bacterium]|jgi:predicted porin|nr:hypothetical protein [Thiotrichales bacterium]MBT3613867.1 hypothetical protein [Thiotrichales bacterium]MBT3752872.1 hypothetical protein [Thiotrichales bacterium]MBT4151484.1 hypothetical protein [Thiotrichales bacterium]MBT4261422.1 hypothetical protein [Thiotrichales bacterium]